VTVFLLIVTVVVGFYMAWNIGANDVANSVGTSVGSGVLTLKGAVLLAAVFEFSGAFFAGGTVARTMGGEIVPESAFADPNVFALGMMSVLLAAAIWINIVTWLGKPVSTTNAIVGALVGFGLIQGLASQMAWGKLGQTGASWIISPILGGLFAFVLAAGLGAWLVTNHSPERHAGYLARTPWAIGLSIGGIAAIVSYAVLGDFLPRLATDEPAWLEIVLSVLIGLAAGITAGVILHRRIARKPPEAAEYLDSISYWFGRVQIATAAYMCFAHGSNDVANAVGPLAGAVNVLTGGEHNPAGAVTIPTWVLLLGGAGIVVGLATYGYKIIETIATKITQINPLSGFCAQFSTATVVLVCSQLGLPVSTTCVLIGAITGIGFARGQGRVDWAQIGKIVLSWIVTIPLSAALGAGLFLLVKLLLL
jgi:PiT family inorganic phosphate transporter